MMCCRDRHHCEDMQEMSHNTLGTEYQLIIVVMGSRILIEKSEDTHTLGSMVKVILPDRRHPLVNQIYMMCELEFIFVFRVKLET